MEEILLESTVSSLDALLLEPLPPDPRERLLRFALGDRAGALVPLDQLTEILHVNTAEILPVPEMPSCVLGIHNWRGEMLWLVDFNDLIGYASPFQQQQMPNSLTVMVAQVDQQSIGIGVQQVHDIELHDLEQLQPSIPGLFPPNLLPLMLGTLPESCDAVVDIQAISRSPLWKTHPERSP